MNRSSKRTILVQFADANVAVPGIAAVVREDDGVSLFAVGFQFVEVGGLGNVGARLRFHGAVDLRRFEIGVEYFDGVEPVFDVAAIDDNFRAVPLANGKIGNACRGFEKVERPGSMAGGQSGIGNVGVVDKLEFEAEGLGDLGIDVADLWIGPHTEDEILHAAISALANLPLELAFEVAEIAGRREVSLRRGRDGVKGAFLDIPGFGGEGGLALGAPAGCRLSVEKRFPVARLRNKGESDDKKAIFRHSREACGPRYCGSGRVRCDPGA